MSSETRPPQKSGQIRTGNDGHRYISVSDKNGAYHWKRLREMNETATAAEYFNQFPHRPRPYNTEEVVRRLSAVKKDLRAHGVILLKVSWKDAGDFIDFAWDAARGATEYGHTYDHKTKLSTYHAKPFMFYTEHGLYGSGSSGMLHIYHDLRADRNEHRRQEAARLAVARTELVSRVMAKWLGKRAAWNGTPGDTIDVKLVRT